MVCKLFENNNPEHSQFFTLISVYSMTVCLSCPFASRLFEWEMGFGCCDLLSVWRRPQTCLGEFIDEAQLEVSNDEEDESHDSQSQMILPQTPGWVIDALFTQKLLTCGAAVMRKDENIRVVLHHCLLVFYTETSSCWWH